MISLLLLIKAGTEPLLSIYRFLILTSLSLSLSQFSFAQSISDGRSRHRIRSENFKLQNQKKKKLRLCLNNWFEFELVWQWWSSWAVSRCYRGYQARLSGKSPKLSLSNAMVWVLLFHFSLLLLLLARNCSYKLKRLFIYLL